MRGRALFRYGIAVLAVAVATLIRLGFEPILETRGPFVLMFLAVAVAAWNGGFGPGLLATILSGLLAVVLFIDPALTFFVSPTDWVFTGLFLIGGTAMSALSESMHRAQERAAATTEELRREVAERERIAQELRASIENEKRALAESEIANRAKDEFLATVSHELRTPLNSMLGWSQILQVGRLDDTESRRALETIERNARHQAQLIEDVLEVSRIVSGKIRLDVRPVNPMTVVVGAIDVVRPAAEARQIRLKPVLDPAAGPVSGDPSRLQQVVWNLISNAVKFTPVGGQIDISLSQANSHVEIAISDTGEGIDPQFLPFVFERFRQANSSINRPHGGLGLGLSIVRHLVELHGGTVDARSDGIGQGSVFTVRLPVMGTNETAEGQVIEPYSADRSHLKGPALEFVPVLTGVRVLVAEDEPDSAELVRTILARCGAEVHVCESAEKCFAELQRWLPDVLISDVGMPGEDGYSLIKRIRSLPPEGGGQTPAMALTAFARIEDRVRALSAGYQTHVPKPVDSAELIAAVASLVKRSATSEHAGVKNN